MHLGRLSNGTFSVLMKNATMEGRGYGMDTPGLSNIIPSTSMRLRSSPSSLTMRSSFASCLPAAGHRSCILWNGDSRAPESGSYRGRPHPPHDESCSSPALCCFGFMPAQRHGSERKRNQSAKTPNRRQRISVRRGAVSEPMCGKAGPLYRHFERKTKRNLWNSVAF